jgi:hypothetical protein
LALLAVLARLHSVEASAGGSRGIRSRSGISASACPAC